MGAKTVDVLAKKRLFVPGPGSYVTDSFTKTLKKDPSVKFGTEKKLGGYRDSHIPGPGNYDFVSDDKMKL